MTEEACQENQRLPPLPSVLLIIIIIKQEWRSEKVSPLSLPPAPKLWLRDTDKNRELKGFSQESDFIWNRKGGVGGGVVHD